MTRIYRGIPERTAEGGFIVEVAPRRGGPEGPVPWKFLDPRPSQGLINHSPDGFAWGYGGSGPAQLALALLLDVTRDPEIAIQHYQRFKGDVVTSWDTDKPWTYTEGEILMWLRLQEIPVPGSSRVPEEGSPVEISKTTETSETRVFEGELLFTTSLPVSSTVTLDREQEPEALMYYGYIAGDVWPFEGHEEIPDEEDLVVLVMRRTKREEIPQEIPHFDEEKIRADAKDLLEGMGIPAVEKS